MSNNFSPTTRALLDAAKHDGPSRERRAAMWTGVTGGLVTHTPLQVKPQGAGASGANGAAQAGAAKGAFWAGASMKGAFIGALFGSAISIGVATFMLRAKTEPAAPPPPPTQIVVAAPQSGPAAANANAVQNAQSSNGSTSIELPATNDTNAQSSGNSAGSSMSSHGDPNATDTSHASSSKASGRSAHAKRDSASTESPDEMLAHEAALVGEARRELLTGDPAAALKSARAARSLEVRQMDPEEMGIEVKALRALGRDTEADRVESQLRTMYPGR